MLGPEAAGAGLRRPGDRPSGPDFAAPGAGPRRGGPSRPPAWDAFWRGPGASPSITPGRPLGPLLAALEAQPGAAARAAELRAAGLRVLARHGAALRAASRETGLTPPFLLAMALTESGGDSDAVSPAGAMGLMQLMPAVMADQGVADPFSAAENAPAGARHFAAILARFQEDPVAALAAWNAGPEVVARSGGAPDWPETRAFVPRALTAFAALRGLCAPVPEGPRDACGPVEIFADAR
ncbi:MAG: lytic transglycosylase domain-containing protein [Pseudomonadota bacterium]|nr:lytic transglycosylase domain-containing protein [Pseudomonadota bacterium]